MLVALVGLTACGDEQSCDMLFVQEARGMAYDAGELTLKDTNPNILFFCDRPVRVAGHMTHDAFIQLVTHGDNNFVTDPPNAAVSIFGVGGEITEVVVALNERPMMRGNDMVFAVNVLDGELPAEGGAVSMFIDPIGRPLSPGSIAGVHRRHVRRAIRREAY